MNKLAHIFKLGRAYKLTRAVKLSYPPYQYTIEPTNICNLKCHFCPQSDPEHTKHRAAGHLTEENLLVFFEKRRDVKPGNKNINFTLDGEPFINKNFIRFIEIAAGEGLFSIFASNGIFIKPDKVDRLARAGPFRASIDFSSEKPVFESIRGREGNFDIVLENLRYMINKAGDNSNVHLEINDITSYIGAEPGKSLIKLKKLFPAKLPSRVKFRTRQFHNFCGHLDLKNREDNYRLCPYPWTQMAVTYDGHCVPCCRDTAARSMLGNVFVEDIMTIWNGERYRRFRQNLLDHRPDLNPACANCDLPHSGGSAKWSPGYMYRSLIKR